jgi:hypothetical protein
MSFPLFCSNIGQETASLEIYGPLPSTPHAFLFFSWSKQNTVKKLREICGRNRQVPEFAINYNLNI